MYPPSITRTLLHDELLTDNGLIHTSAICIISGGAREPARRRGEQPGVRGEPAAPGPRVRLHGRHPHSEAAGANAGGRARHRQGGDRQAQVPSGGGRGGHGAPLVARLPAPRGLGSQPRAARRQQVIGRGKSGNFGGRRGCCGACGLLVVVIGGVRRRRRRVELNGL